MFLLVRHYKLRKRGRLGSFQVFFSLNQSALVFITHRWELGGKRDHILGSHHILDRLCNKPKRVTTDFVFATFCHVIPRGDYKCFLQTEASAKLCFIYSNKAKPAEGFALFVQIKPKPAQDFKLRV